MEKLMTHLPPLSNAEVPSTHPRRLLKSFLRQLKSFFWKMPKKFFKRNRQVIPQYTQALVLLGTALFTYFTFFYTEEFLPTKEQPILLLTATLEEVGRKTSPGAGAVTMIAVKAAVNAQNTSKTRVTVVSAFYNVRGSSVAPGRDEYRSPWPRLPPLDGSQAAPGRDEYSEYVEKELGLAAKYKGDRDTIVSRYDIPTGIEVIHSSNLMQGGWALDPGEQYSRSTIFYVPEGAYDFLNIKFDVHVAKDPQYKEVIENRWRAEEDGELHNVFFLRRGGLPCDENDPARNCDEYNPKNESQVKVKEKYGVVHSDVISVLSLWKKYSQPSPSFERNVPAELPAP
jgi:hypothetical protein